MGAKGSSPPTQERPDPMHPTQQSNTIGRLTAGNGNNHASDSAAELGDESMGAQRGRLVSKEQLFSSS
ncbi:hypothetical protein VTO42DRAFT_6517 [Malbranchea cinnamomea]